MLCPHSTENNPDSQLAHLPTSCPNLCSKGIPFLRRLFARRWFGIPWLAFF
ncbi:hypothetical protein UCMB321_4610 [Pseudomonas batumici]|uniref:Uncharacterized protein n=1 Tax=Pseudomonas batumici TaxID=226910 RepID=A0A0C2I3R4_9PSED|nr:hypothetical protein UCMB321_4610 [Pseudomonas batumici]